MMLLVIDALMVQNLEEGRANEEGRDRVQPASAEGAAVEKLVPAREAHALHLESVEDVHGDEC